MEGHKPKLLGQLASTAICGNDITSSCLYVSALAIGYAGRWAPVCLLLVAATLYLFRSVYAEVAGAMPLNGGAYSALLNTPSKYRASIADCLTILSYMATAEISSTRSTRRSISSSSRSRASSARTSSTRYRSSGAFRRT